MLLAKVISLIGEVGGLSDSFQSPKNSLPDLTLSCGMEVWT